MRFNDRATLSSKQAMTPEGYLICYEVPLARTGTMFYTPQELELEAADDGVVHVSREDADLFNERTMMSLEGKPFTIGHPRDFVGPENWRELTNGHLTNIRRGDGEQADLLLGDLLVTSTDAIRMIRDNGVREVSLGYDAEYVKLAPGRYAQRDILGNHIALVPAGRCGARCAIGDEQMSIFARIRKAMKTGDSDEAERLLTEAETKDGDDEDKKKSEDSDDSDDDDKDDKKKTGDAIAKLTQTVDALSRRVEALTPKPAPKTTDAAPMSAAEIADLTARAEILAPGLKVQTTDACSCKRDALAVAYGTETGRKALDELLAGKPADFRSMPQATVDALFLASSAAIGSQRNAAVAATTTTFKVFDTSAYQDLPARAAAFWAKQQSGAR